MGKFLKKNWFVVLIAVVFIGFVSYYIYDTNKGKLKGKQSNGEDVVFEVDGKDTTASSFYDELYKSNGSNALTTLFKKAVADASVKTTSDIKDTAKKQAESIRSNYQSQYGDSYETYLKSNLESTGYTDLEEYLIEQQKINQVTADYAKKNFKDLQIRQISYILVKFENSDSPAAEATDDEKSRMQAVDDELAKGTDFAKVATDHSEDTSTASKGGDLGVIDKNASTLDSTFLSTALSLKEGEVSDWVRSDQFGYFKIKCTAASAKTLENNYADSDEDPYVSLIENYDSTLENTAIWQKADELGIKFDDKDVEKKIKKAFNQNTSDKAKATASPEASASPAATSTPAPTASAAAQ